MKQFYEAYRAGPIVSPPVRQLPRTRRAAPAAEIVPPLVTQLAWTHHLIILGRTKRPEEREFYLRLAVQERWSKRELERQFDTDLYARTVVNPPKVAALWRQIYPDAEQLFRDRYAVEFLDLPAGHTEGDLHRGLVAHMRQFLQELGRHFCFVGERYRLQVGPKDFHVDLVFFTGACRRSWRSS